MQDLFLFAQTYFKPTLIFFTFWIVCTGTMIVLEAMKK